MIRQPYNLVRDLVRSGLVMHEMYRTIGDAEKEREREHENRQ